MAIYIYILRHPETHQIHYVGKTNSLRVRRKNHCAPSAKQTRTKLWLLSLRKSGLQPIIEAIEEVDPKTDWQERERHWIAYYRALGCELLNVSIGGGGDCGHIVTEDTREKLRQRFKGRPIPPEQRAQISKTLTGKKQSPETTAKRRATINANRAAKGLPPWNFGRDRVVSNRSARERRRAKREESGALVMGSPEWKEKIRQSLLKRNATLTKEQRRQIAAHLQVKPRPFRPRGPMPEEQKEKIRESVRRTKARQKQEREVS